MVTACSKQRKQQRSIDDARTIGLYIMYVLLRKVDNKKKELRMGPTLKKKDFSQNKKIIKEYFKNDVIRIGGGVPTFATLE